MHRGELNPKKTRVVMNKYVLMLICFMVWKLVRIYYLKIIRTRGYSHVPTIMYVIILLGFPVWWFCWESGKFIIQSLDVIEHFEDGQYECEHTKFIDDVIARMQRNRALKYMREKGHVYGKTSSRKMEKI